MKSKEFIFTNNLKKILAEKKLTHSWLAGELGIHPKIVAAWCENKRQPRAFSCFDVTQILDVGWDEFMTVRKAGSNSVVTL